MKFSIPLAMSAFVFALSACSNGGGGGQGFVPAPHLQAPIPNPTSSEKTEFSYEYKYNGCTTGKRTLSSKKEYCDALLNDALNNNCAREMRIEVFNRQCTGEQVASPGVLPTAGAARCVVNGMDLKDRTFLDNLNPFNPQRRQSFRDMFWGGRERQTYNILFSAVDSYGKATFTMTPSSEKSPAMGQIQLQQRKGADNFVVASALGSQMRLVVTNYKTKKEVEAVCLSNQSFKRSQKVLTNVRCSYRYGGPSKKLSSLKEENFTWDTRHPLEKEIYRGRDRDSVVVRLKPGTVGQDERIEVEAVELEKDKTIKAEASLNEGLQISFEGRQTGTDLVVTCAPASK